MGTCTDSTKPRWNVKINGLPLRNKNNKERNWWFHKLLAQNVFSMLSLFMVACWAWTWITLTRKPSGHYWPWQWLILTQQKRSWLYHSVWFNHLIFLIFMKPKLLFNVVRTKMIKWVCFKLFETPYALGRDVINAFGKKWQYLGDV